MVWPLLALLAGEHARLDLGQTVSDATKPRLKVSRPGLALIKSFEGFRPRAVRNRDGRWVIGYGHTASAREGLEVSEADAELLLQYDLLPVVRTLNDQVGARLNQHQFDALASFVFSVGVERFATSDVLQRLDEGRAALAADALLGWPAPVSPEDRLRRRVAERALFNADPNASIGLADLLAAPLPFPEAPDARAAAVAVLLGEHPLSTMSVAPFPAVEPEGPEASVPHRYSPYAAAPVGPLPGFPVVTETATVGGDSAPADEAPSPSSAEDAVPGSSEASLDSGAPPQPASAAGGEPAADSDEADQSVASVLRHEDQGEAARRSDRAGAGSFLVIGGAGLAACAGAAAAFRLAVEQLSPMGETLVLAWALALIGVMFVGVAAWNLYRRWGSPD